MLSWSSHRYLAGKSSLSTRQWHSPGILSAISSLQSTFRANHLRCSSTHAITPPAGKRTRVSRRVSTLDPSKLTLADYIELSGLTTPGIAFGDKTSVRTRVNYKTDNTTTQLPFPTQTSGYIYFDCPDEHSHPASGTLKLRICTPEPDVRRAFAAGHDLLMPNGWRPWGPHLLTLHTEPLWVHVYELLRAEGLVTNERHKRIAQLVSKRIIRAPRRVEVQTFSFSTMGTVLEPFPLNFSSQTCTLTLLDPEEIRPIQLQHPTTSTPTGSPYSGVGLVQFEASTDATHSRPFHKSQEPDHSVLVMRFLKWLEPPQSSIHATVLGPQIPGTLVKRWYSKTQREMPWTTGGAALLPPQSWAMLKARDLPASVTVDDV